MLFRQYDDVALMYADTREVLSRHEAQNLIPLGNLVLGASGNNLTGSRDPANWFMGTVSDETGIRLTAVMTPPHNLTLYATDNEVNVDALACLVEAIASDGVIIPGLMTEVSLAGAFVESYQLTQSGSWSVSRRQRIYELTQVNATVPRIGTLRAAKGSDAEFLPDWFDGFYVEDFPTPPPVGHGVEVTEFQLSTGRLFILEHDGVPVSMASSSRSVQTVCGISSVYTPPEFRRNGYASSCVAGVSQLMLDQGFASCALYTDLANPISNSIYQKIGYKPVCDSVEMSLNRG